MDQSCSVLSKVKGTNAEEIWNKVQGPPLYVIPKVDGTALFKTWLEARQYCLDLKGDLLSIRDWSENQRVVEFVKSTGMTEFIWIGMNDRQQNGTMEWSNGSPVTFTNWSKGQPENEDKDEDCAAMFLEENDLPWFDAQCNTWIMAFICKIPSN
eukprot:gene9504-biopygen7844